MMNGAGSAKRNWVLHGKGCQCEACYPHASHQLPPLPAITFPEPPEIKGVIEKPRMNIVWPPEYVPPVVGPPTGLAARISSAICKLDAVRSELVAIKASL